MYNVAVGVFGVVASKHMCARIIARIRTASFGIYSGEDEY